ncbi:MAG: hypothetical protein U0570_04855 [Phycisphaerales bacterium]
MFAPAASAQCVDEWVAVESGPAARQASIVVSSRVLGGVVLFGGYDQQSCNIVRFGDTWLWRESQGWQQMSFPNTPSAREGMMAAYDSARGKIVMFGGNTGVLSSETWELGEEGWVLRSVGGPSPREWGSMAFDSARGVCVLFGGNSASSGGLSDTWEWNGSAWTQRNVSGPSGRRGSAMAFDESRQRIVLFGGWVTFGVPLGDTWEWNGSVWQQFQGGVPPAAAYPGMCYDPDKQRVVLFAGAGPNVDRSDTWVRMGTNWSQLAPANAPASRNYPGFTFDVVSRRILMFGGSIRNSTCRVPFGDTVLFTDRPVVTSSATNVTACMHGEVTLSVVVKGYGAPTYRWQYEQEPQVWIDTPEGAINFAGGTLQASGGTGPALYLQTDVQDDAERVRFRCVVSNACGDGVGAPIVLAPCQSDLTCDNVVDDEDFVVFAAAYNVLDCADPAMAAGCPADLNGDGLVDDGDFVEFVAAYNNLGCL